MTQEEKTLLEERIVDVLKTVYDPEIPVNIYDLGMIYKIDVQEDSSVELDMTFTAPNCPAADYILEDVRTKVESVEGVKSSTVNLVFEPAWDQSMMSEEARVELGFEWSENWEVRTERYDYIWRLYLMMKREKSLLLDKSEKFAGRVLKMYQYLTSEKKELIISKQVLRSGTSIGANITESRNAQSTADFIHKLNIALKEADETIYWIKNLHNGNYLNDKEYESIYNDADELVRLLVSSIKTLKQKHGWQPLQE